MNREIVDPIADAVLYEGFILYPYRPSTKNRHRWTFGGLYPEAYCRSQRSGESPNCQTECLIEGRSDSTFEAVVRLLQLTARTVGQVSPPLAEWVGDTEPPSRPVDSLRIGEQLLQTWQEAEEREIIIDPVTLEYLTTRPQRLTTTYPGGRRWELVRDENRRIVGVLSREQETIEIEVEAKAIPAAEGLFRFTLRVTNRTPVGSGGPISRDDALLRSAASTHAILGVRDGRFVSLMDPPARWRQQAMACRNIGTWPVLVGDEGRRDMILSSPIILYDYPQVAPESPGDFFDGAEIDEMLALRVLTMTDGEKGEMAAVDEKAGALLARVEGMAREHLLSLHGTLRDVRPVAREAPHE
jgi:hydrogenase maturation protease